MMFSTCHCWNKIQNKKGVNKLLEIESELDTRDDKEYKVEALCNNEIYVKKYVG